MLSWFLKDNCKYLPLVGGPIAFSLRFEVYCHLWANGCPCLVLYRVPARRLYAHVLFCTGFQPDGCMPMSCFVPGSSQTAVCPCPVLYRVPATRLYAHVLFCTGFQPDGCMPMSCFVPGSSKTPARYWAIQAGLLTPLTFAWHHLIPLAAFTSGA